MFFFYLAGKTSDPDLALEALDDPVHVGVIVQRYCLSLPVIHRAIRKYVRAAVREVKKERKK
jgi:hypothetical protein